MSETIRTFLDSSSTHSDLRGLGGCLMDETGWRQAEEHVVMDGGARQQSLQSVRAGRGAPRTRGGQTLDPEEEAVRMRGLIPSLALSLAVVAAGCAAPTPAEAPRQAPAAVPATPAAAPPPAAAPAAPPPPVTVKAGLLGSSSDAGVYIGDEKGYYRQQGIEIQYEAVETVSSVPMLTTGQIDIGGPAVSLAQINAFTRGLGVKLVA